MVRMKLMHSSTLYGLPLPSPNLAVMFHIKWRTSKLVSVPFNPTNGLGSYAGLMANDIISAQNTSMSSGSMNGAIV